MGGGTRGPRDKWVVGGGTRPAPGPRGEQWIAEGLVEAQPLRIVADATVDGAVGKQSPDF